MVESILELQLPNSAPTESQASAADLANCKYPQICSP
jgi:hypothetical protein